MKMRTTIRLDDQLLIEAKLFAAQTGRTLTSVVDDALREVLARRKKLSNEKTVNVPSHGSGGLQPGIDLDNSASLWDMMDRDDATD